MNRHRIAALIIVFCTIILPWQATYGAAGENLAAGRAYTFSIQPNYPLCTDDGDATDLTDGIYVDVPKTSSLWGQKGCVGWQHTNAPVAITIDLGATQPIGGVTVRCAANASGVSFPSSILIQTSEDGQNFVTAGDLIRLAEGPWHTPYNVYEEYIFRTTRLATKGRYVRFNMVPSSIFLFVDEIEVHRGDSSLLSQPASGTPSSEAEVTDALRLTQLGVYRRIRSDIDSVRVMMNKYAPKAIRAKLTARLTQLSDELRDGPDYPATLEGFRAVLPVNALHAEVMAVYGEALAATTRIESMMPWHTPPYQLLDLFERPTEIFSALKVRMLMDEYRAEVFNLTNASGHAENARFTLAGIPDHVVRVYQVEYVDTREFTPVASALVELFPNDGIYETTVPAGMTRQIWLSFNPRDMSHAGTHDGQVIVESLGSRKTIDLKLSIVPVAMPAQLSCAMGLWDYITDLNYGITEQNAAQASADMKAHFAHTVWCGPGSVPMPTAEAIDADGNLIGEIDYTAWDKFVRLWPDASQYMAFAAFHHNSNFAGLAQGTAAFDRLVRQWADDWARHNREALGIEAGRVMLLAVDEPGGSEDFLATYRFAKPFRQGTRDILLFVDPVGLEVWKVEHAEESLQLADVISPTLDHYQSGPPELRAFYQSLRAQDRQLWFYMCSGPTRHFDPSYYRLQPLHAFAVGGNGSQFWSYGDNGRANSWNEYLAVGGQAFTPVYLAPDTVTTSKHWEAAREGVQDYEYAVMLRNRMDSLDVASAKKARQLFTAISGEGFNELVSRYSEKNLRVFNNASSIAEELRLEILDLLSAEQ